jgi:hypothetical protein
VPLATVRASRTRECTWLRTEFLDLESRYFTLFSPMTAYLLGALSYPTMHILESGTRYDSIGAAAMSLTFVCLLLIPAGLIKPFLTWRTGKALMQVWAYHAISPHVTGGVLLQDLSH